MLMMPELKTQGEGQPNLSLEECPDGPALFEQMEWEGDVDWADARLKPLLVYLKGNKHLKLPERWRKVLPRKV